MSPLTLQQYLAIAQTAQTLVAVGIATAESFMAFIKGLHPGMPEADLNAILDFISVNAARHKALADADAGGP